MPNGNETQEMPLEDFIALPDTVAIVGRVSEFTRNITRNHPEIRIGKYLTGNYGIAYLPSAAIPSLIAEIGPSHLSMFSLALGLMSQVDLEVSGITAVQQQPYLGLRGQGVLVGFIDTGIDYTNTAFLYNDGSTRIQYIWDQTLSGNIPEAFPFGAEYTAADIDAALQSDNPHSLVPHEDTVGHGTFLASVAASHETGEYIGAAPDSELIVVKLKKASQYYLDMYLVPPEQENVYETVDLMLGIEYIISRAAAMQRPVAICIGVGTNFGAHDGTTLVEEYLSRLSYNSGIAICSAAGNESAMRHHTQGVISSEHNVSTIEIITGDQSSSFLISLWNNAYDTTYVTIMSPTGETVGRMPERSGTVVEARLTRSNTTVIIEYYYPIQKSSFHLTIIKLRNATPGNWTITIHGVNILEGNFHAWLPITGFVDPEVTFLEPSPNCTICVPSTGTGTIKCGAYNSRSKSLYYTSSWGPTQLPLMAPDLTAPGVEVGGTYPNNRHGTMSGTSVATAITTGACALMLEWGIVQGNNVDMNTYTIRSNLVRGCIRDAGVSYPNVQWGFGRLNLINTFYML